MNDAPLDDGELPPVVQLHLDTPLLRARIGDRRDRDMPVVYLKRIVAARITGVNIAQLTH